MNLAGSHIVQQTFDEPEATDIVVRSYTTIGQVRGVGKIEIDANEIILLDQNRSAYSIKIGLETIGDYPQSASAVVDYSNIDKLLAAIDRLSSVSISTERFAFSEVEYTIDGLTITVFNDAKGKLMFVVKTQNVAVHFTAMNYMSELKKYILRAKQHLDAHKREF